jgi:hypothetical protein
MNLFGFPLTPLFASCGDYVRTGEAGPDPMTLARTPTPSTITFEVVVLLLVLAACAWMWRVVPRFGLRFLATAAGVLIFEVFTAPMWRNEKLGAWGYVYHDVSWILTLGWTTLILGASTLVDHLAPRRREGVRFVLTLGILLPLVIVAENVVLWLQIRDYAPEVKAVLSGPREPGVSPATIPHYIGLAPLEILYYVPVFTALVLGFAKYWFFVIDDTALAPVRRQRWLRSLGLTALAVLLFELMIEPMVENSNFPSWSYFYRDLSFLLTGLWVVMIAAVGLFVQHFLGSRPIPQRFAAALFLIAALALPVESWLIHNGYRVYGPSATANFCGYNTWLTGVPVEIAFAIPLYMALLFGFIRYWEIVGENRL